MALVEQLGLKSVSSSQLGVALWRNSMMLLLQRHSPVSSSPFLPASRKSLPVFLPRRWELQISARGSPVCQFASAASENAYLRKNDQLPVRFELEKLGIVMDDWTLGKEHRLICPQCNGGTTYEPSFSLRLEDEWTAIWKCHRSTCGYHGKANVPHENGSALTKRQMAAAYHWRNPKITEFSRTSLNLQPLSDDVIKWFATRGISQKVLQRNRVEQIYSGSELAIAFPYYKENKIIDCKYRTIPEKRFWKARGAARRTFYGLEDIKGRDEVVIVEGEMDKLSMEEAGIINCVSVPDGAPVKAADGETPDPEEDKKFSYLWDCKEQFGKVTRIFLATDADGPGLALAEELARRFGRERCWRVNWPVVDGKQLKDANEVLLTLGPEALREVVAKSELYPIRGLFQFSNFFKEIDDYYHMRVEEAEGASTGWKGLDEYYTVVPGELTIVTGVPNSGKSEWIDALVCNLNRSKGWSFALCSMENKVTDHARKLIEKHYRKPFFEAKYSNSTPRLTPEEFAAGLEWLDNHFYLIRCENEKLPSADWVLDRAKAAVQRYGIRGLVIDPYNELDHQRSSSQTETEYVSQILTKIKRFAQHHDCHVWFVAHPRQMLNWQGQPPNMYDISGSAHFINKCDNGIVVHRNRDAEKGPLDQVQILVKKVRNKIAGQIGEAVLKYDRVTGLFSDAGPV
ncbi:twinkle homolog protein, chloroplastic/mitochondrial isoform X2 [Selaginella moellendorffii]|uniref:twinkle homolog protein, chloroplastic/mitochondrial isoform X2 n=1 Tax=Selaginella moellendorffii TaxID=88036 RepID=UPI000D1C3479|nr:twinkle homolog protein, chloroplastic/mitochondrial isoform X2 [Selaginella moellendorffii]|eukprot:XP_002961986.2 twinkle homolog protein, chloroplastic/mitochondrial isoform X2 [Selaginella moellendorffii]